jgi:hypothetical protein
MVDLSKEDLERILYWYSSLNPNETADEDFLPDALLARKLMVAAEQDTKIQDSYIKELQDNAHQ